MSSERIPSLDGLRALSITGVLFSHFSKRFYWYGQYGVLVFFVISGYLITHLMMKEKERTGTMSIRNFYIRRAFRILPVAYLFLAIMTLFFLHGAPHYQIAMAWLYLLNYVPVRPTNITQLWSLGTEEQFYWLWPMVFSRNRAKQVAWFAVLFAPILRIVIAVIVKRTGETWWFPTIFAFPTLFDYIAIGCLLALYEDWLVPAFPVFRSRLMGIFWVLLAAIPILQLHTRGLTYNFLIVLFNVSVAACILHAIQTRPWLLNNKLAVWVGVLSYSLYIWHMPFANPAYHIPWPIGIAATFATASASYYLVERPILSYRQKLSRVRENPAKLEAVAGA